MSPLIEVKNLKTHFATAKGTVKAVDGVDIAINAGDTLGIVGESGCGKTVLALSILRLIPTPPGRIISGQILFEGCDLLQLTQEEMRQIRGRDISMVFQEPMTSLNPVIRVGEQVAEGIRLHQDLNGREANQRAIDMLRLVGIPAPEIRAGDYPHQMSGGMRQRVMIAMALACNPRLMLADEPTTALDVTIQAQIIDLINRLKIEQGTAVMLVTHDLGLITEAAQRVAVMYAGRIVEQADVSDLFRNPLHPYTIGLMLSIPGMDQKCRDRGRLAVIPGSIPPLYMLPAGCSFQDRCADVMAVCRERPPELTAPLPDHQVRCWKYG
jgi:peptide/nickel transport system ATP-binding protein/oligopeptide transport system ATP-binding protein